MRDGQLGSAVILSARLLAGATVGAQTRQEAPPTSPQQAAEASSFKITGCLERDESITGGASRQESEYKLTHLTPDSWKKALATRSTTVRGTGLANLHDVSMRANSGVDFNAHVGHMVELTSTLTGTATGAAAAASPTTSDKTPILQVSALRMIAARCQ
jgi:hypothetical protein